MQGTISRRLWAKAGAERIPLTGAFELLPICNFACKMCYVRKSRAEVEKAGGLMDGKRWLEIAEDAAKCGLLFPLLTGGEPFLYEDFQEVFAGMQDLGMQVSINSNASRIDQNMARWLGRHTPTRINITLYGASEETYQKLCGNGESFLKVKNAVRWLKQYGVPIKLNASITPQNVQDLESMISYAKECQIPIQAATYMFPPIRRDETCVGHNDRFTACEAADYSVRWDRLRLPPEQFQERARAMKQGLALPSEEESCEGTPGEGVSCRAGRSAFWINWQGGMTPCGMMTQPLVSVPELGFARAWEETKAATARIRLPGVCAGCRLKNACHACAAMCVTETGRFDARPDYVCEMTHETVRRTIEEAENEHS